MTYILHIETALDICSIAISSGDQVLSLEESKIEKSHSKEIMRLIELSLKNSDIDKSQLNAIAVSEGPGSYTGLRIGASVAKGLSFALDIPIIAISTLDQLIQAAKSKYHSEDVYYSPMVDARRLEVYYKVSDVDLNEIRPAGNWIFDELTSPEIEFDKKVVYFGNGAEKGVPFLEHHNFEFIPDITVSAKYMIPLAFEAFQNKKFESTVYFEPDYVKAFQTTVSKKKPLI